MVLEFPDEQAEQCVGTRERWESTRKVLAWRAEKRVAAGLLPLAKSLSLG
jgi:hypothetical protein